MLIYVMLTGESPFLGEEKQETFLNVSQVNVDYSQDVFQGISDLAVDFIQSLLIKTPGRNTWLLFVNVEVKRHWDALVLFRQAYIT